MSAKDNGGAAFPKYFGGNRDLAEGESAGMSLRDYFAGQALNGLCACPKVEGSRIFLAEEAFKFADAMLSERAK